jgi:hypothetical protein
MRKRCAGVWRLGKVLRDFFLPISSDSHEALVGIAYALGFETMKLHQLVFIFFWLFTINITAEAADTNGLFLNFHDVPLQSVLNYLRACFKTRETRL